MGDLAHDTAVEATGGGTYRATLHRDWEIWGPMGGYVAACALRAAGAESPHARPAAFSCHFMGVGRFAPIDLRVETRKGGRTATSQRVEITQEGRPILDAMVWSVSDEAEGLEHDETTPPEVAPPTALPTMQELLPPEARPPFPFWDNFESRPVDFEADWPPDGPREARWRTWLSFRPTATFADPWVDAARSVILVDLPSWPAAQRPHAWTGHEYMAPTLDLSVAFHRPTAAEDWLLCEGVAPVSAGGLLGWTGRVWSVGGQLLASGGGQCLYRPMRPRSG